MPEPPGQSGPVGGLLLTGGASRRMGRDKASLGLGPNGEALAAHLGRLLAEVTEPVLEVGPGVSGLRSCQDEERQGPLGAVVCGRAVLARQGHEGPVLVLATDLPFVTAELLSHLARHASPEQSVVPEIGGRLQPLCARWSKERLGLAAELLAAGERRVQAAFADPAGLSLLRPGDLGDLDLAFLLADVDDEEDLRRLGLSGPAGSD